MCVGLCGGLVLYITSKQQHAPRPLWPRLQFIPERDVTFVLACLSCYRSWFRLLIIYPARDAAAGFGTQLPLICQAICIIDSHIVGYTHRTRTSLLLEYHVRCRSTLKCTSVFLEKQGKGAWNSWRLLSTRTDSLTLNWLNTTRVLWQLQRIKKATYSRRYSQIRYIFLCTSRRTMFLC